MQPLWTPDIAHSYKHSIRAFLLHFHTRLLKEELDISTVNLRGAKQKKFDFRGGSVGNFFFTGARLFFRSLEAAVFWFSKVAGILPDTKVEPICKKRNSCILISFDWFLLRGVLIRALLCT